ncbi:hypothetical protein EJ04DRAFT_102200 [Polyplosphaeria fusca]|uniref:Uncharacterized protein n=1 Tax=Polyplosphaeria fusca TaxID=682080 RepID=A0A9P4R5T1_9PLEO|nr:hypothetical protein EJ04DRAFT_102200 [Polyplosphaeria fusca]
MYLSNDKDMVSTIGRLPLGSVGFLEKYTTVQGTYDPSCLRMLAQLKVACWCSSVMYRTIPIDGYQHSFRTGNNQLWTKIGARLFSISAALRNSFPMARKAAECVRDDRRMSVGRAQRACKRGLGRNLRLPQENLLCQLHRVVRIKGPLNATSDEAADHEVDFGSRHQSMALRVETLAQRGLAPMRTLAVTIAGCRRRVTW